MVYPVPAGWLAWSWVMILEQSKLFSWAIMARGLAIVGELIKTVNWLEGESWQVHARVLADLATHQLEDVGLVIVSAA